MLPEDCPAVLCCFCPRFCCHRGWSPQRRENLWAGSVPVFYLPDVRRGCRVEVVLLVQIRSMSPEPGQPQRRVALQRLLDGEVGLRHVVRWLVGIEAEQCDARRKRCVRGAVHRGAGIHAGYRWLSTHHVVGLPVRRLARQIVVRGIGRRERRVLLNVLQRAARGNGIDIAPISSADHGSVLAAEGLLEPLKNKRFKFFFLIKSLKKMIEVV